MFMYAPNVISHAAQSITKQTFITLS